MNTFKLSVRLMVLVVATVIAAEKKPAPLAGTICLLLPAP